MSRVNKVSCLACQRESSNACLWIRGPVVAPYGSNVKMAHSSEEDIIELLLEVSVGIEPEYVAARYRTHDRIEHSGDFEDSLRIAAKIACFALVLPGNWDDAWLENP